MDLRFTNSLDYDPGISEWDRILNTKLIVIAEVDEERGVLFVSSDGRYFVLDYCGGFGFAGEEFQAAIEVLLLGKRLRPLLRPTESSIRYYGDDVLRGDPSIYDYETSINVAAPGAA